MFYADIYRPKTESQLIGESQLKVWRSLKKGFNESKIEHKLMFCGDFGLGKTTLAEMYIRLILNLNENETLDDKIIRVNCGDKTGVDYHRALVDRLNKRPLHCQYNIYFLDEVHKLSASSGAQDVWLSPLENLPDFVIIIGATTNPEKLKGGFNSRFEKLYLKSPSKAEFKRKAKMIIGHLKKLGQDVSITEADIDEVINLAQGNIRDFDGYLQSKIEGRFNELDAVKQNKFVFDLIFNIDKKGNSLYDRTKWAFAEAKELEMDYVSFVDGANRAVIGMLRNGSAKDKALGRSFLFLECFGNGLDTNVDSYISFHTGLKRYLENL